MVRKITDEENMPMYKKEWI